MCATFSFKNIWREYLSIGVRITLIRCIVYLLRICKLFHDLLNNSVYSFQTSRTEYPVLQHIIPKEQKPQSYSCNFKRGSNWLNQHSYRSVCKNVTLSKQFKYSCRSHTDISCLQAWDIGDFYVYWCKKFYFFGRSYWCWATKSGGKTVTYILPTWLFSTKSSVFWIKYCTTNPLYGICTSCNCSPVWSLFSSLHSGFPGNVRTLHFP
jgi:hypothetical protein